MHTDELLVVELPLIENEPPVAVVAQLVDRQKNSARLVLSDEGGMPCAEFHLVGGQMLPEFNARSLGPTESFLSSHQEATRAVVLAGGVAHGNLMLARAVHLMSVSEDMAEPDAALARAVEISRTCAAWCLRLASRARTVAAG